MNKEELGQFVTKRMNESLGFGEGVYALNLRNQGFIDGITWLMRLLEEEGKLKYDGNKRNLEIKVSATDLDVFKDVLKLLHWTFRRLPMEEQEYVYEELQEVFGKQFDLSNYDMYRLKKIKGERK